MTWKRSTLAPALTNPNLETSPCGNPLGMTLPLSLGLTPLTDVEYLTVRHPWSGHSHGQNTETYQ